MNKLFIAVFAVALAMSSAFPQREAVAGFRNSLENHPANVQSLGHEELGVRVEDDNGNSSQLEQHNQDNQDESATEESVEVSSDHEEDVANTTESSEHAGDDEHQVEDNNNNQDNSSTEEHLVPTFQLNRGALINRDREGSRNRRQVVDEERFALSFQNRPLSDDEELSQEEQQLAAQEEEIAPFYVEDVRQGENLQDEPSYAEEEAAYLQEEDSAYNQDESSASQEESNQNEDSQDETSTSATEQPQNLTLRDVRQHCNTPDQPFALPESCTCADGSVVEKSNNGRFLFSGPIELLKCNPRLCKCPNSEVATELKPRV